MNAFEVPLYATTLSAIAAWCRAGNLACAAHANDLAGGPRLNRRRLGWGAKSLSQSVFNGALSAEALVDQHSHLRLFCSVIPLEHAERIRQEQIEGSTLAYHMLNQFDELDLLESNRLRRCSVCVREDVARYGVAHWRLHHQWPFARHCAEHRVPLLQSCEQCRRSPSPQLLLPQLAHDACVNCTRGKTYSELMIESPIDPEAEAPYWSLLDLAFRAQQGEAPELRPAAVLSRVSALASRGISREALLALTLRNWRCKSESELATRLGVMKTDARCGHDASKGYLPLIPRLALLSTALSA